MTTKLRKTPLATALLLGTLLCLAGAALAVGPAPKTAEGEVLLASSEGTRFVQSADGDRVELPLPAGSRVSDFRSASGSWLVAAVNRAAGAPGIELLQGQGDDVQVLPSPALDPSAMLTEPVFVADEQGFQALVWLAGEAHDKMAVKASRWLAGGWGATETISPPGPGTQIALSTAVLADGSWLVAWAAFDGRDDEILWSRFSGGTWSAPAPIADDNAVPDVTPSLFATAGGALAAWSRYDGNDYRINVARFDGERWSAPAVAGPAGSTEPAFSDAATPYLIYHHADPAGWAVMELDAAGGVVREATFIVSAPERPALAAVTEEGARFEWVSFERQMESAQVAWE